ncbi:MAG: Gfo/Idh/MocA family oxidoreductase [Phycisphaerae bacterium]|nr:Gfo/Idh/MocA family oxidoreductase [Phycisphaerae bacterium]
MEKIRSAGQDQGKPCQPRSVSENPVVGPRASGLVTDKDGEAGDIGANRRCSRTQSSRKTSRSKPDRILPQVPNTTRRKFLGGIVAGAGFAIVPRHVLGGQGYVTPSDRITLGLIGLGGQGHVNLFNFLKMNDVQVSAVCDVNREGGGYISWEWMQGTGRKVGGREPARRLVDEQYAQQRGTGTYRGCRAYADYRELLAKEDVDAVMVATPDHTHAMIVMAALKQGKHVYCEKPLAYTVHEARTLAEAARQAKVATQLGNHGQATEKARLTQEIILDGAIGHVREVHIDQGRRFWDPPTWGGRPPEAPPLPEGLDWDAWLGPAPARPFHPAYHPWRWRDWRDFGTSPLGDMGCHVLSTAFKALKLRHPSSVEATCTEIGPEIYPRSFKVSYEFPARGDMPPVTLVWYDEGYTPPRPKALEPGRRLMSPIYIGDGGTLIDDLLIPESRRKAYGKAPRVLPRSPGQYREWIDACRGGAPAGSDFVNHSGLLTETPLLGNIAIRTGKKLQWDGPNLRFTNDDTSNQYLHRTYREGWSL